jgi:ABC-type sugar transport system permease subunit
MLSRRRRPLQRSWCGFAFVLPVVAFFAVFNVFPVLFGFYLSLTDYDLLNPPEWVGLANFQSLFDDRLFITALGNTFVFVLGATLPVWIGSLLAALLFDQRFPGRNILKTVFFLPVLPPVVVVAVVWRMLLHPSGVMTWLAGSFRGVTEIDWLTSTTLAPVAMIVVHDWAVIPFFMMIWLAGLSSIPPELREAALIDGAGPVRIFWDVELPQLRWWRRSAPSMPSRPSHCNTW